MPWSARLTSPITLRDGRVLRTLREGADLLIGLSESRQAHPWVQHAARLLIEAADTGKAGDVKEATLQLQRALSREGMT